MAKDEEAGYWSGPARSWLKVKIRHEGAFPLGGIAATPGGAAGVLVGRREQGALRYLGTVEFGHNGRSITELTKRAAKIVRATSPFTDLPVKRGATWLESRLLGEVTYAEIVRGRLRALVWRGLRERR